MFNKFNKFLSLVVILISSHNIFSFESRVRLAAAIISTAPVTTGAVYHYYQSHVVHKSDPDKNSLVPFMVYTARGIAAPPVAVIAVPVYTVAFLAGSLVATENAIKICKDTSSAISKWTPAPGEISGTCAGLALYATPIARMLLKR